MPTYKPHNYAELKHKFDEMCKTELDYRKAKDEDGNYDFSKLSERRQNQFDFIDNAFNLIDKQDITDVEKALLATGAILKIKSDIEEQYKDSYFPISFRNSIYTNLLKLLNLSNENELNDIKERFLIGQFKNFQFTVNNNLAKTFNDIQQSKQTFKQVGLPNDRELTSIDIFEHNFQNEIKQFNTKNLKHSEINERNIYLDKSDVQDINILMKDKKLFSDDEREVYKQAVKTINSIKSERSKENGLHSQIGFFDKKSLNPVKTIEKGYVTVLTDEKENLEDQVSCQM